MRLASPSRSSYVDNRSPGSRLSAALLSAAITALVILMLLRMGFIPPLAKAPPGPTTLTLLPEGQSETPQKSKVPAKTKRASGGAPKKATVTPKKAPPATPPATPTPPVPATNFLYLSKADMAAADISTKPTRAATRLAQGDAGDGTGSGRESGDADGAGSGPHGERLYRADWYVRPTDAQMATYMPSRAQSGWGEIACRTASQYRVEDCEELGETPGSGLSRTLREAAWQFRVLPPRIGGRSQVGTWVRIHFDFTLHDAG